MSAALMYGTIITFCIVVIGLEGGWLAAILALVACFSTMSLCIIIETEAERRNPS